MSNPKRRLMLALSAVLLVGGLGFTLYANGKMSAHQWLRDAWYGGERSIYSESETPTRNYGIGAKYIFAIGFTCITAGAGLLAFSLPKTKNDAK